MATNLKIRSHENFTSGIVLTCYVKRSSVTAMFRSRPTHGVQTPGRLKTPRFLDPELTMQLDAHGQMI